MPRTASVSLENIETDFSTEVIEVELPGGTRGLQGPQGIQGETGKTPQFHVGSVTDTDEAEVSITGTIDNPVLNMGLPRGKSGVYTGTEEPSSDYDVWIIPDGTPGTIPTKTSDLTNDSGFIDKDVNTLTNYELKTNTGAIIDLSIDSSTYVMTLALKNSAGTTISTDSIDLPLETMVVGASYDNQTKEIVLTLKNGNTTRFSVADLVSGLVSSDYLTTNYYDKTTVDTNIANVVTDSSSQSTTTAYSCNYVNNAVKDVYSTNEVKTNKVWIDGKPVYRAIFTGRKTGNSDLNLGTISNTDTFVSITGILIDANNNKKTIPFYYSDSIFITVEVQSSGTISIHGASSAFSSGTVTMIIEYTKTTD